MKLFDLITILREVSNFGDFDVQKNVAGNIALYENDSCIGLINFTSEVKMLLKDMNEIQLYEHLNKQLRFIYECQTLDTIGSMLIIFGDNGISQYDATVDPETTPEALRELADKIEKCQTVKRY